MTDAATADAAPDQAEPGAPPYNVHPAPVGDGSPPTAVELAAPKPPRCGFDLERSRLTAGLVAAIARAQSDIRTVGKDSRNEQRKYDYASADDMIGECRRAFSRQGVAILSAHYMQEPWTTDPISVDEQGNATQWIDCTLKGETILTYCEPTTREVGLLVVKWEQDAIGKRGTPIDKSQRAAETYALGFVSRSIGHMSRAAINPDEDRDAQGDDQGARGRGRGAQQQRREGPPAQQGTQRTVTSGKGAAAPGKGAPAGSVGGGGTDKLAGLRDSVIRRFNELGGAEWKKWGYVCQGAGLDKVVRVGDSDAETLRKLHDYLEAEQAARDKAEAEAAAASAEAGDASGEGA